MKKIMGLLLTTLLVMSLFVGCGSKEKDAEPTGGNDSNQSSSEKDQGNNGDNSADKPKVGVTIYKFDDNFMTYTRNAMTSAAEGNAELVMNDSQNNQSVQNDQVDVMINKGVKALVINLVDPGAAPTIADKAKAADIPLIFVNKEYPEGTDKIDYNKVWYVGTQSKESGDIQGKLVAEAWKAHPEWDRNGDGVMQYVMLMGEPGHPDAEARTKYSVEYIKNEGIKVEELEKQTGMWDATKGKELMTTWLGKEGDKIEMVLCNNDGMALGVVEALKADGYFSDGKYMPVVGVDAIPEALDLIQQDIMLGTVLNDPLNQGRVSIEMAINSAAGKDVLDGLDFSLDETKAVRIPYQPITKDNLDLAKKAYGME
ncbi:galactose ABC transporter substrate-binding protein [Vallitalea guaymasensis]|uniref:galactose ABC transporter substrate-binding protein n=1 Tax=Vallitalea guaymasensis TaxID=1185412 RepID=UPI00272A164D|nr:galactose ABC transporter substrate-binding protein [Vallitalea guaymasensis]